MTHPGITRALGRFASEACWETLPDSVREAIKLRVLDQFGAALAGYSLGTAEHLLAIAEGSGTSTFWGSGRQGTRRDAALFNAFISHACYMEDGSRYTGGHAACIVIPPAFVLTESIRASGREFITGVAVGYEVFLRLGRALYPSIVKRGFQSTAALGGVAAGAACASLLRLTPEAATSALALGAMTAVGFKESIKSTASQPFQVGRAAEGGLAAALLAQAGTEGAPEMLEKGLCRGFADDANLASVLQGLGQRYSIDETYLKRHGGCRGNHAPIDVTEKLVAANRIELDAIGQMNIHVDSVTFAEDIRHPCNGLQAQQSIAYAVAANLVFGDASFRRYTDENLRNTEIRSLMDRIDVERDATLDAGYPDNRPAVARITLRNNTAVEDRMELAKGEPENPVAPHEIERKFFSLSKDVIGAERAHRLFELVEHLEELDDLSDLVPSLIAPAGR